MIKIIKNPDTEFYNEVTEAINKNDGYCCCAILKNNDTKCMCKNFRETDELGECDCGRFIRVEE